MIDDEMEKLALAIHERLGDPREMDANSLRRAAVILLGREHPAVKQYTADVVAASRDHSTPIILPAKGNLSEGNVGRIVPDNVVVEGVEIDEDGMLPPGEYEVAVVFRGQDNVLLTLSEPLSPGDMSDLAKNKWANCETTELGNEWQEPERFVIRPEDK